MTTFIQTSIKFAAAAFLALFATALIARSIGHSAGSVDAPQKATYARAISHDGWLDAAAKSALRLNA